MGKVFLTEYYINSKNDDEVLLIGIFSEMDVAMDRLSTKAKNHPNAKDRHLWWVGEPGGTFLKTGDEAHTFGRIRKIEVDAPLFPPLMD